MNSRILIILAGCCAALPACAQDDADGTPLNDIPHVTIVGTAHVDVAPDLATITLGVTTEKPTAPAAAAENARKASAVVDTAKAQGVAPADIATQSVTLNQTFDNLHDAQGRITGRKPRGFEAQNIIAIRARDLGKAGALAQSLIEKGANRFDGIGFSVEHPEPIVTRLTGEAVKNAREQAQAAADAAGVKLGRVLLIARPGDADSQPMPMRMAMRAKAPAPAVPIEAGTTSYDVALQVIWALGD